MHPAFFASFIATLLALPCGDAQARPSPEEKAAARAAFWGLFADTCLSLDCFEQQEGVGVCVEKRLSQASHHSQRVDSAAAKTGLRFLPRLAAVKGHLNDADLAKAKDELFKIKSDLIEHFAADTAPAIAPDLKRGEQRYQEYCASCHGAPDGTPGALQRKLKITPQPLSASWRKKTQSPLGVYATLIHGVDGSEMLPLVEILDIDELWSIAFFVSTLTLDSKEQISGKDAEGWIDQRGESFSLVELARLADQDLVLKLQHLGRDCGECLGELYYLRGDWLAKAPRMGEYGKDERKAKEARGLTILITLIVITSIGFGFILSRRSRFK
jgi:mono/diheme cytochrome c family protein